MKQIRKILKLIIVVLFQKKLINEFELEEWLTLLNKWELF